MKEDMSLSNLGTVTLHATKVPTNMFSSTLICILTLDYYVHNIVTDIITQVDHICKSVLVYRF